jgi:hypothetical protein
MREKIRISKNKWHLWLDKDAKWENDTLFLPSETIIEKLPVNPPSVGWDELYNQEYLDITLPATVEEYYSERSNIWTYHGVSWFFTELVIPDSMAGKRISLHLEKTRLRAEIYINQKLAGYDLVSETPYEVDVTDFLNVGQENRVAIRITNAGGVRGWNDINGYMWGKHEMLPSHDFSIVGNIDLVSTEYTYIKDVFVKNIPPACKNAIEIQTEIISNTDKLVDVRVDIISVLHGEVVYSETSKVQLTRGVVHNLIQITVPKAKQWDINNPYLYLCQTTLSDNEVVDIFEVRFGFRVMEVREAENGNTHLFLNGKRFRHKSAIDWGFYANTGALATEELAKKSVIAAKKIGHTGINMHRQIGEPLLLDKADELGLYMYEEPGGIKSGGTAINRNKSFIIEKHPFQMALFEEKLRRMVTRDRNHPSLLMITMCNEDKEYTDYRKKVLKIAHDLDSSKYVINSSGTNNFAWAIEFVLNTIQQKKTYSASDKKVIKEGTQYNYRPYSDKVDMNHVDIHTVDSGSMFDEGILSSHSIINERPIRYWGEVACYCGPSNWYKITEDAKELPAPKGSYDLSIYESMHNKIEDCFQRWNLKGSCGGAIQAEENVSKQAGRGLMYIDGRLCQVMSSYNGLDGFAINGWSSGPQAGTHLKARDPQRTYIDWDSAIVDEGRNLKGPAEDYAYYTRPLQVAIFRTNGKYFKPGEIVKLRVALINEAVLNQDTYSLRIRMRDESGRESVIKENELVDVRGNNVFSQEVCEIRTKIPDNFTHGHVSFCAELLDSKGVVITDGAEQVLFSNPKSLVGKIGKLQGANYQWKTAEEILRKAGANVQTFNINQEYDYIVAKEIKGGIDVRRVLEKVKNGSKLIIEFDRDWANLLFQEGILKEEVSQWGCKQEGFWYGNGWGYISRYVGNAIPSGGVIGTNGWQPSCDPQGFYPLVSDNKTTVDGLWFARHDVVRVLNATIEYGKGKIILNPSYRLSKKDVLSTVIFYNMIMD